MLYTTKDDIKTQLDLNIYGWDMRIMQIEEDIADLKKKRKEMMDIYSGLIKERDEQITQDTDGSQP